MSIIPIFDEHSVTLSVQCAELLLQFTSEQWGLFIDDTDRLGATNGSTAIQLLTPTGFPSLRNCVWELDHVTRVTKIAKLEKKPVVLWDIERRGMQSRSVPPLSQALARENKDPAPFARFDPQLLCQIKKIPKGCQFIAVPGSDKYASMHGLILENGALVARMTFMPMRIDRDGGDLQRIEDYLQNWH